MVVKFKKLSRVVDNLVAVDLTNRVACAVK